MPQAALATLLNDHAWCGPMATKSLDKVSLQQSMSHIEVSKPQLQAEIIKLKLPWIVYNQAHDAYVEAKEKLRDTETALAARKAAYEESQVPIR